MTKPSYEELARKSDAMADILAHALRCGYLPAMTAHEAETILKGGDVGQQSALFQSLTQSLARVRGLLQRLLWVEELFNVHYFAGESVGAAIKRELGAESADIGKLDAADEK